MVVHVVVIKVCISDIHRPLPLILQETAKKKDKRKILQAHQFPNGSMNIAYLNRIATTLRPYQYVDYQQLLITHCSLLIEKGVPTNSLPVCDIFNSSIKRLIKKNGDNFVFLTINITFAY